jgi:hypothetical protein
MQFGGIYRLHLQDKKQDKQKTSEKVGGKQSWCPPKRRFTFNGLLQKTALFISTGERTWNPVCNHVISKSRVFEKRRRSCVFYSVMCFVVLYEFKLYYLKLGKWMYCGVKDAQYYSSVSRLDIWQILISCTWITAPYYVLPSFPNFTIILLPLDASVNLRAS